MKKFGLILFAALLCLAFIPALAEEYVLDATKDLPAMAQGDKQDGDSETFKDYFTVLYSAKNKIDGSNKTFDDGYTASQRLNFGGKTQPGKDMINSVRFETKGAATVKFWWVSGGDGRQFALYDASTAEIAKTTDKSVKNSLYISTFEIDAAGVYYLGVPDGSNYLFKLQVTEHPTAQAAEYVLDATKDLPAMAQGDKQDGDSETFKDYFTVLYSAKNKIDGSNKTFDDGYTASQRLNFGGKTQPGKDMINSVRFETKGAATVKFWWVSGGDGRQFALYDASTAEIAKTTDKSVKNSLYISTFEIDAAGVYYLGVPDGSNYLFKLQVTEGGSGPRAPRAAWESVSAPEVLLAQDTGDGEIEVSVTALIGYDGADELIVAMLDGEGKELDSRRSLKESDQHTLTFAPSASGDYRFEARLSRTGEEVKLSQSAAAAHFILPLGTPHIISATSAGGGSAEVVWTTVPEATGYEILCNNASCGTAEGDSFTVSGLTVGEKYDFAVRALRNAEAGNPSAAVSAVATQEAQRAWSFTVYGPSTNEKDNGYLGSVNEDGFVTVYSENGKGKIQPNADDGLAFYYTAIPANQNFTLRAKVHVDGWSYSNGQEGFGLMAADSVPPTGTESFFTNQYMALATKIEYYFQNGKPAESGTKYTMRLGLGMLSKLMRTPKTKVALPGYVWPLETSAVGREIEGVSAYNVIGNNLNPEVLDKTARTLTPLTDFILEIQKNNTGYFITYYGEDGKIIGQYKDYNPAALSVMDENNVYVGFFAARNARATFSDIVLDVIDPLQDSAVEEQPIVEIVPTLAITSSATANSESYTLSCVTNVAGTIDVYIDDEKAAEKLPAVKLIRNDYVIQLPSTGEMLLEAVFTPDAGQDLGEYTVLKDTRKVSAELTVAYVTAYRKLSEIYVSPTGSPAGLGTIEKPLTLHVACQYVQPGQTIILQEGTYNFVDPLRIPHGIDGTEELPIRLIADPAAATRPVLDFKGISAGIIHGGDWWYFEGFDVTGAANAQKGFQVSGHHNTLHNIHTYRNGNTGIQISRYAGTDPVSDWPSHNLILNCTSYENADAGYEDADGFAAKLTCGEGNVFDGCVAYHNADDGFDLYAKIETGPIGKVVIRNSVAYLNGILPDGTVGGNGNGFKMGGSNMPGGHSLIDSYAFFNRSQGIDANSCPDLIVENCVSYNNQRYNVAFYTNIEQDTAYQATNVISFKDASIPGGDPSEGDELKPRGAQKESAYLNDACYYWNGAIAVNAAGDQITAEDFVSLEFTGVERNADGSINLNGFLELKK